MNEKSVGAGVGQVRFKELRGKFPPLFLEPSVGDDMLLLVDQVVCFDHVAL